MSDKDDIFANLFAYIGADKRICPQPLQWKALWEMLPDKERRGLGWSPPLPLILAAWYDTSALEKQLRLGEHIEYAARKGVLKEVDKFLRNLRPDEWHTLRDE